MILNGLVEELTAEVERLNILTRKAMLEALASAIESWRHNATATIDGVLLEAWKEPFCSSFLEDDCEHCPVHMGTSARSCNRTPYARSLATYKKWLEAPAGTYAAAKAERAFRRSALVMVASLSTIKDYYGALLDVKIDPEASLSVLTRYWRRAATAPMFLLEDESYTGFCISEKYLRNDCDGCPVKQHTGQPFCGDTSRVSAYMAYQEWLHADHHGHRTLASNARKRFRYHAGRMVNLMETISMKGDSE